MEKQTDENVKENHGGAFGMGEPNVTFEPRCRNNWHRHGAKNCWFSHIAVEIPGENTSNEWLEPVTDEEYDKL